MRESPPAITLSDQLERLYRDHRAQLLCCALTVVRDPDAAEDAVHDAFCRLVRLRQAPRNLKAYAFRSVRNAAIDIVRKHRRSAEETAMDDPTYLFNGHAGAAQDLERAERRRRVIHALGKLTENEREIIVLRLKAELTFREISEVLERPQGTVASHYRRGVEKLREHLHKEED